MSATSQIDSQRQVLHSVQAVIFQLMNTTARAVAGQNSDGGYMAKFMKEHGIKEDDYPGNKQAGLNLSSDRTPKRTST